jgi:hypothetical protein
MYSYLDNLVLRTAQAGIVHVSQSLQACYESTTQKYHASCNSFANHLKARDAPYKHCLDTKQVVATIARERKDRELLMYHELMQ